MLKFVYIVFLTIFKIFCGLLYVSELYFDRSLPRHVHYDYIIGEWLIPYLFNVKIIICDFLVGSGSAGSNLHGLRGKVLLLEAGGYGSSFIFNIPIVQPLLFRSDYDYRHETIPQEHSCKALHTQISFWPAGKIIAGTTRMNNMIYHRCHHADYEDIVERDEAEKLFKKMEEEVPVSETYFKSLLSHAFISGAKKLGFDGKIELIYEFDLNFKTVNR